MTTKTLTQRDYYIVAQALHVAAREMKKIPAPHNEPSNVKDMERLLHELFPHYEVMFKHADTIKERVG